MGLPVKEVRTGRVYLFEGKLDKAVLERIATRILANGVIESIHFDTFLPKQFPQGHPYAFKLTQVPLRNLSDDQLKVFSREKHLFLSLDEMKAIQSYFQSAGREPTDIELETIAQTWSEHCVHKTLKSSVEIEVQDETGKKLGSRSYKNLIKDTIFKSTQDLIVQGKKDFCLSVFKDNAGVIAFDDTDAVLLQS